MLRISILTAPIAEENDFVLSQNPWKLFPTSFSSYRARNPSIARARQALQKSDNKSNKNSNFAKTSNWKLWKFLISLRKVTNIKIPSEKKEIDLRTIHHITNCCWNTINQVCWRKMSALSMTRLGSVSSWIKIIVPLQIFFYSFPTQLRVDPSKWLEKSFPFHSSKDNGFDAFTELNWASYFLHRSNVKQTDSMLYFKSSIVVWSFE